MHCFVACLELVIVVVVVVVGGGVAVGLVVGAVVCLHASGFNNQPASQPGFPQAFGESQSWSLFPRSLSRIDKGAR